MQSFALYCVAALEVWLMCVAVSVLGGLHIKYPYYHFLNASGSYRLCRVNHFDVIMGDKQSVRCNDVQV